MSWSSSSSEVQVDVSSGEFSMKSYAKVLKYETVSTLKRRIYEARSGGRDLPNPSKWALVYDEIVLKDEKTLEDYNIEAGAHVTMEIKLLKGIDITLNTPHNQTFTIDGLSHHANIHDLQRKIDAKYGVCIRNQIICNGVLWGSGPDILPDFKRLNDIDSTTLDLVIADDVEAALKQKRMLLHPYKFEDDNKDENQLQTVMDDKLEQALAIRYPVFLSYDDNSIQCIFVYLNQTIESQLPYPFNVDYENIVLLLHRN